MSCSENLESSVVFCNCVHPPGCTCKMCCMRQGRSTKSAYRASLRDRKAASCVAGDRQVKRPTFGQMNGPTEKPYDDQDFATLFPTLHQYITCTSWEDGKPRTTSTLLFFLENGVMKCCVNDRDNNRSAFFTATTFNDLLLHMETRLSEETADWKIKGNKPSNPGYTPF